MMTGQAYQRWSNQFEYQGSLMQRGWTREDWQYEDQMNQMQFGWSMEDINENLRYAKGRERKQLLKQRERLVTTENLEQGQTEKVRSRQEELWAREDERYQKATEYAEKMMQYDKEQFELSRKQRLTLYGMEKENLDHSVEEYKKEFDLQSKIIELNREHQAKSLELQEQALAVQAAAAVEAKNYADQVAKAEQAYSDTTGEFKLWEEYNPQAILEAMSKLAIDLSKVDISIPSSIGNMAYYLDNMSTAGVNALTALVNAASGMGTAGVNALRALIDDLRYQD
jgi:hypothetical protein